MRYFENILHAIGHTPLVKLSKVTDSAPVTLLAKVESLNPGGSVKDRIGLAMIEDAERRGLLRPGGTIVEPTAGNTGVGLALVAARKGYRCIFVMPDKMSEDKVSLLKAYGAEVVITPSVPPDSPDSFYSVAARLAREIPGAFQPNQFANPKNPEAHYRSTGPEIWEDTDGQVDVFVAGVGTGGTLSGVGRYLKERNPRVAIVAADPAGSILSGDAPQPYRVEGIGVSFIPATLDRGVVDEVVRVTDAESFAMARRLTREEGLIVGGSAGTAVVAALKYARREAPGKLVVVLLPDTGRNYMSRIYSDRWMQDNGFSEDAPGAAPKATTRDVLNAKRDLPALMAVRPGDEVAEAVRLMEHHGVSQLPVIEGNRVLGSVDEGTVVELLHGGVNPRHKTIAEVMGKPLPQVDEAADIAEPYGLLRAGHAGVVVTRSGVPCGFLTRIDLVNFWSTQPEKRKGGTA